MAKKPDDTKPAEAADDAALAVSRSLAAKAPKPRVLSPEEEIAMLEQRIAADQARLEQLRRPFVEFPKMVRSRRDGEARTFKSRTEQDAAGPDFADVKA